MRRSQWIGIAISLVAAVGMVVPGAAQSGPAMQFNVPFAFLAGDQMLPAGAYTVTFDEFHRAVLECRKANCGAAVLVAFETSKPARSEERGALRFDQYGDFYVLRQVGRWGSADWSELTRSEKAIEAARMHRDRERVTVGAQ